MGHTEIHLDIAAANCKVHSIMTIHLKASCNYLNA